MPHPVFLAAEVRTRSRRVFQAVVAHTNVATHTAGEVDDHVDLALADTLHDLPIEPRLHTEGPSLRIAYVDMDDGGASLGRLNGGIGDLLGRDCAVGAFGDLGVVARNGARDDDIGVHDVPRKQPRAAGV